MSEMRWKFDASKKELYLVDGQRKIKILKLGFLADNVAKDYCGVKGIGGELKIAKIEETPKDKILRLPEGDIAFIEMNESYKGGKFLIFTPDLLTKEMLADIMCQMNDDAQRGKDSARD
jgi:hypothetical protein